MTVKELKNLALSQTLSVRSGYNGKLLTKNYNPSKHENTIGAREVISIWSDIEVNKTPTSSTAHSVLCCTVHGDIEYNKERKIKCGK